MPATMALPVEVADAVASALIPPLVWLHASVKRTAPQRTRRSPKRTEPAATVFLWQDPAVS